MLLWIVELGCVCIICEVFELTSMMRVPQESYLDQVYHIPEYLRNKQNDEMVLDPTPPIIDDSDFLHKVWSCTVLVLYSTGLIQYMPMLLNQLEILMTYLNHEKIGFTTCVSVDADHAGNLITQYSCFRFIIFFQQLAYILVI